MAKAKKTKNPSVENLDGSNISKEELETRRKDITSYYEANIPHLKIQKEYEDLLRDIEKTSFDTSKTSGSEAAEQIKRTLKRQTDEA